MLLVEDGRYFSATRMLRKLRQVFVGITLALIAVPVEAAELKEIQQRGYLIVAVKDNLRPLGFRNAAGQLQGLEIEIAQALAQALLGRKAVVLKPVANADRIPVVLAGQADLTIARVTATAARSRLVNFSTPYYVDGTAVITRDPAIQDLSDLAGRRVAVLQGSSTIASLRFTLPEAKLVGVDSYQAARSQLQSGTATAFAADASVLTGWVQEAPQYHLLPSLLSAEPLVVVLPKGLQYEPLRRRVDNAINGWRSGGWLKARSTYWGLPFSKPLSRPFGRLRVGE